MLISLRRPNSERLSDVARHLGGEAVTYAEEGATQGRLPTGYRHDDRTVTLGDDTASFERAAHAILDWQAQRSAGIVVGPSGVAPTVGATVVQALKLGPVWVMAPCRVVWVVDSDHRRGFAYGTLPGHPERGEEAFVVERDDAGVRFRVVAFSRPAALYARLGIPVARTIQVRTIERYLEGIRVAALI